MFELIEAFKNELTTNSTLSGFAGGAVIMSLFTAVFYYLRSFPVIFFKFLLYQLTVNIVLTNDDYIFSIVNEWFSRHEYSNRARRIRATHHTFDNTLWSIAPGFGWHLLFLNKRPVFINRVIEKDGTTDIKSKESYTILTIGRKQKTIRTLLTEAAGIINNENLTDIYTWSDYWHLSCSREMRGPQTIVLKEGQFKRINEDIRQFRSSSEWYFSKGVPYRRGYLFFGDPGTGKTSIISVLSGIYKAPIYILSINGVKGDNAILRAIQSVPNGSFVLIEDVDAAKNFNKRKPKKRDKVSDSMSGESNQPLAENEDSLGVTLSGLLNAIDGVGSKDGRILFMTTNHPEKLDEALIRPGRIDVKEEISLFGPDEAKKMIKMFYENATEDQINKAASLIKTPISPAVLQNIFMKNKNDLSLATREMMKVCRKAS